MSLPGLPMFAQSQFAAVFAPTERRTDLPHAAHPEHLKAGAQEPVKQAKKGARRARRNAAGLVLALALGCTAEAREPIPTVDLEPLAARVEALDARREFVRDASEACRAACLPTVPHRIAIYADHAACECWRPNVGVKEVR